MIKQDGNGGWWAGGAVNLAALPIYLPIVWGPICEVDHFTGAFICTRRAHHGGRHAAGVYLPYRPVILAVWR